MKLARPYICRLIIRFRVHTFSTSIVERLGERGVHGSAVKLEAAGERVDVGQVLASGMFNPAGQALVVVGVGREQCSEVADESGKPGHFGAGAGPRRRSTLAGVL